MGDERDELTYEASKTGFDGLRGGPPAAHHPGTARSDGEDAAAEPAGPNAEPEKKEPPRGAAHDAGAPAQPGPRAPERLAAAAPQRRMADAPGGGQPDGPDGGGRAPKTKIWDEASQRYMERFNRDRKQATDADYHDLGTKGDGVTRGDAG